MNNNDINNIRAVTIRPSSVQWVITFLPHILLAIAGCVYVGMEGVPLTNMVLLLTSLLVLYLGYQLLYLQSIRYHISSQQLVTTFGVLHRERNYMELYRVVDYYEHQSLMQRICGLKTITVFSTDRNTPQLHVIGVKNDVDIVGYLRQLVFYNRKRMGIHEFANVSY